MNSFNTMAASLMIASAMAAITPVVKGYFSITLEIGKDMLVSVDAQSKPTFEIFNYRVWTLDEDCNEVDMPMAYIDTDMIESAMNT